MVLYEENENSWRVKIKTKDGKLNLPLTGKTLEDNNLRVLRDGLILKSTACLFTAKKKAANLQPFLNSLV